MSEIDNPSFTAVAPYYDALMRDVPYRSWVAYLQQLLDTHDFQPKRVLDLACGTGTVAELLRERRLEVVGVDISPGMILEAQRKSRRKGSGIAYYLMDASEMEVPEKPFDLCVSLFDSLNYIHVPQNLDKAIQRVHDHLRPGGFFIFDINSEFALVNGFFDQEHLNNNDRLRYVWRSEYDPESRMCRVEMRFFLRGPSGVDEEFRETHVQFAYTEDELRVMLTSAGFTDVTTYHAYSLRPVKETTDRIFFVAAKPG